jgi:K+-transporting ATPase ATPase C chain
MVRQHGSKVRSFLLLFFKKEVLFFPYPRQKPMLSHLRPAISLIVLFTLLTGVAFPLAFVGIGQIAFPFQANGSLVSQGGKMIGSAIIGQNFTSAGYFHPRPSALMGADPKDATKQVATPYDASESGASNLAATSKALIDRVTADAKSLGGVSVPADAVTTSASGLDPDISPENAASQVARVAAARKLPAAIVAGLVAQQTRAPLLGFVGQDRVNVLALNMALDAAH